MVKRLLCVLLSLMLVAGLTAAWAEESAAVTEAPASEAETTVSVAESEAEAPVESEEPVLLATVNGEEIMSDHEEIQYWINYYLYQLSSSGYEISDPEMLNVIDQYALFNTIRFILIRQKAAELGLDTLSDEEKASLEADAKANWELAVSSYTQNVTDESSDDDKAAARADAIAALKNDGYEEESYVNEYIESEKTNLLINRLMDHVAAGMDVTDEEVQAYFNELVEEDKANYAEDIGNYEFSTQYYQQPSYYTPEGYRGITHILLKVDDTLLNTWKDLTARFEEQKEVESSPEETPDEGAFGDAVSAEETPEAAGSEETPAPTAEPVTEEMIEAAKQAILDSVRPTVDEIMAKLKEGVSFDDLILEYGTDPGMQDEATRSSGYPVHKDSIIWDPAFTAGAIALEKVGDVSEPVLGQYGVHILHYLRDIPGGAIELTEAMKKEFHDELLDEKRSEALSDALDKWMNETEINYTEAGEAWKIAETEEGASDAEDADGGVTLEVDSADDSGLTVEVEPVDDSGLSIEVEPVTEPNAAD